MSRALRALALVAVVALLGVGAISGGAAAADVEVHNETVDVDADTDTAWADLENTNATTNASATVSFYGIDNGTETQIGTSSTIWIDNESTKLVESDVINGTANDSVRVVATVDNSTVPASNVTVTSGTFQQVAGGGGGGGVSGTGLGLGVVAVLAVGAVVLLGRKDG